RAGDHADGTPAPALIEQRHRACRALAPDLQPSDIVADLDRQRELGLALALAVLERERSIAERQALDIQRAHRAGFRAAPPRSPRARPARSTRRPRYRGW